MLWRCWLGGRKGTRPVKTEWWGAGVKCLSGCLSWAKCRLKGVCVCVQSVLSWEIGQEEHLRNDLFCVEWDAKPRSILHPYAMHSNADLIICHMQLLVIKIRQWSTYGRSIRGSWSVVSAKRYSLRCAYITSIVKRWAETHEQQSKIITAHYYASTLKSVFAVNST